MDARSRRGSNKFGKFLPQHFAETPKPVDDASRSALRGMFLKLELAQLGARLGLNDHVLYTDCDVMFCADVVDELSAIECRYFAGCRRVQSKQLP